MESGHDIFNPAPMPEEFQAPSADKFFVGQDGTRAMLTSEEGVEVKFFEDSYKLEKASQEAGIPINETRVFIQIKCKFDPKNIHVHMLRKSGEDEWKIRFKREWDLYCRAKEYSSKGFPVLKWDEIQPHQAASLDAIGIMTLEQLVVASDDILGKLFESPKRIREAALAQLNYKNKIAEITEVSKKLVETSGRLDTANEIIERLENEKLALSTALKTVKSKNSTIVNMQAKEYLAKVKAEKKEELSNLDKNEPIAEEGPASEGITLSGENINEPQT